MKKAISFLLIIGVICGLTMCLNSCAKKENKAEIFKLVEENKEILLEDIQSKSFQRSQNIKRMRSVSESLDKKGCVRYSYETGDTFWVGSYYEGFYYIESDDIFTICYNLEKHPNYEMTVENDKYTFMEIEGGDNYFYFEKICDNFYYYYEKY